MRQSGAEALCPRCGSTDLTYKNVFDYFKCNACKHTFITPKYVYGPEKQQVRYDYEERSQWEAGPEVDSRPVDNLEATKALARELFGEAKVIKEPQKVEPQVVEQPRREPSVDEVRRHRTGNLGWLILFIIVMVIVLAGLIAWFFYGEEIRDLLFLSLPGLKLKG